MKLAPFIVLPPATGHEIVGWWAGLTPGEREREAASARKKLLGEAYQ